MFNNGGKEGNDKFGDCFKLSGGSGGNNKLLRALRGGFGGNIPDEFGFNIIRDVLSMGFLTNGTFLRLIKTKNKFKNTDTLFLKHLYSPHYFLLNFLLNNFLLHNFLRQLIPYF